MQILRPLLVLLAVLAVAATAYYVLSGDPEVVSVGGGDVATAGRDAQAVPDQHTQQGKSRQAGEARETVATTAAPAGVAALLLRGRLVFSDGAIAPGVKLELRQDLLGSLDGLPIPGEVFADAYKVQGETDRRGSFEMRVARGGKYLLRVVSDEVVLYKSGPGGMAVQLVARPVDLGDVVVERSASIHGRVIAGGSGIEGVEISLGQEFAPAIMSRGRTKTGPQGEFTLRGVRPGKVQVSTRSASYLPAREDLQLTAGQQFEGLIFDLKVGGTISGTVVDDLGKPVAGATVAAARAEQLGAGVRFSGFRPGESTVTDASGRFRLAGLAKQTADLRSSKEGFVAASSSAVAVGQSTVVLEMARLAELGGVLVDERGEPIAGSEVVARSTGRGGFGLMTLGRGADLGSTDAQGRFSIRGVRPGSNQIVASGAAHVDAEQTIEVRPGSVVKDLHLVARRGATLTVSVVDAEGQPVVDALVSVASSAGDGAPIRLGGGHGGEPRIRRRVRRTENNNGRVRVFGDGAGEPLGQAKTDAEGQAVIRGLPKGLVEVSSTHESMAQAQRQSTEMPDGGEASCRVQMLRGGFAGISIVDPEGQPVAGEKFEIIGPIEAALEDAEKNSHRVDAAGNTRIGPLRPGNYRAAVAMPSKPQQLGGGVSFSVLGDSTTLADSEVRFVIKPERTVPVRLQRPILTTVRGMVRDADGVVEGAVVEMTAAGAVRMPFGSVNKTRTDAEGHFELTGLPSGSYTLSYGRQGALVSAEKTVELLRNQAMLQEDLMIPGGVITLRVLDSAAGFGVDEASVSLSKVRAKPAAGAANAPRRTTRVVMIGISSGSSGGGPSTFQMTSGGQVIKTDGSGRAVIRGVPSGTYDLKIQHRDYAKTQQVVVMAADQRRDLGEIKLVEGGRIRGRVTWEKAPSTMALAMVELAGVDGKNPITEMAQNGTFKFEGLQPGVYRLRVQPISASDWGEPQTVELAAGATERVTLNIPAK